MENNSVVLDSWFSFNASEIMKKQAALKNYLKISF